MPFLLLMPIQRDPKISMLKTARRDSRRAAFFIIADLPYTTR